MILRAQRSALLTLVMICTLGFAGCKKDNDDLKFQGTVKRAHSGALSHVHVEAEHQQLTNGVFNTDYTALGSAHTDGSGQYEIPFNTATYTSLRLVFSKAGYHQRILNVDPQIFEQTTSLTKNVTLYTQSTVALHVNDGLEDYDQLLIRYKDTSFDCICCDDEWKYFDQPNIDTTLSCMVYGDQFVHYQYRLINSQIDTLINDSIYCNAFATQTIELSY